MEGALPEAEDEGEDVGLAAEGELADLAGFDVLGLEAAPGVLLRVALADEVEGVAQAALDLEARVDHLLRGDFVRGAGHDVAAAAGVGAAGVFADDDVVDVLGALVPERRLDAGVELHGAEVDVLVEGEAQLEQEALLEDAGLDAGVADGAEEEGVVLLEGGDLGVVDDLAGLEVAFAAEVVVLELEAESVELGGRLEDLDAFANHFGAGAVAADDADVVLLHAGAAFLDVDGEVKLEIGNWKLGS